MFRRDAFVLIGAALIGSVLAVYASLRETPFFPASFQTIEGECPENGDFPAHRRQILEQHEASWFGGQLLDLHEEPLPWRGEGQPTLRFSVMGGGPRTVTVRVTKIDGGQLHLTGKWPHGPAVCTDERGCVVEKLLSPAEQARLETAVEPLLRVPSYGCYGWPDSSSSILEASDGDTYRIWHQRSRPNDDLRAAGQVFLQLAEWPLADEFIGPPSPIAVISPGRQVASQPGPADGAPALSHAEALNRIASEGGS